MASDTKLKVAISLQGMPEAEQKRILGELTQAPIKVQWSNGQYIVECTAIYLGFVQDVLENKASQRLAEMKKE